MTEWIIFVQLFSGFLLISGKDACLIKLDPPRVVVKHGDPVLVNCTTSATDIEGIGWEASQGSTGLQNVSHLMWNVSSLTHWEAKPKCFCTLKDDSQCSVELGLVIYQFPEHINISYPRSFEENQMHRLFCGVPNILPVQNLTITWYKGDTIVQTETFQNDEKKPTNQTSLYEFIPTREDDGTTIRCEADMDLGPEGPQFNLSSEMLNIQVQFGPDIDCFKIDIKEGESLEGKCNVTGNPIPKVTWLKDGRTINLTDPLRRDDTGRYKVKADQNTDRNSSVKEIQVNVLYGPEWICPDAYNISEYTPHSLKCSRGFPKPQEFWYKDEEEFTLPNQLTRGDAGQYWVTVSNSLNSLNFTINIDVYYPPSDIVELEDSEVQVGEDLGLKCSSVGYPRPTYSWSYHKAGNIKVRTEDGVSGLIIHNATRFNTGFYTCNASNVRGNVTKTVRVTVIGDVEECPIEIQPDSMVLEYQSGGHSAVCMPTTSESNVKEIYWEVHGDKFNNRSWSPDTHENWDPSPVCHGEFLGIGSCNKTLPYILYKPPDDVSITISNMSTKEGSKIELMCSIRNVAPADRLNVTWTWQRGNETVDPDSLGVSNEAECPPSNNTSAVNVTCTMNITLNRTHDGIQARCEAELNLGPKGPQPPPTMSSNSFNLSVQYGPTINKTKLQKLFLVIRGYKGELVCEADGNPAPDIKWNYTSKTAFLESNETLIVNEEGLYVCIATNNISSDTHEVEVVLGEDYLPLLAGFVALTVVIISIIFIFIYSIYYKNTKMRRYSLKNPKLSSHNGNVAHNSWDIQLPVTKLS